MQITHQFDVAASIHHLWSITAEDFAGIGSWATSVPRSEARDGPPEDQAPVAGRTCAVNVPGFSHLDERLIRYEPDNHVFAYRVESGMPSFVTDATNTWQLTEISPKATRVSMTVKVSARGLVGKVALPMLWLNIRRTLRSVERDLTHYAETGEVSRAKRRQLATQPN
jgi:hypothetical protein